MQAEHFALNDIHHKPTDQQLEVLMALVAVEARERTDAAAQGAHGTRAPARLLLPTVDGR